MKIKVIDLLNKIANGEEVPEKIKFNDTTYIYYERVDGHYHYKDEMGEYLDGKYYLSGILNHEVEIIEEDKEIEELRIKQEKNIKNNWKWKIEDTEHDYNISTPQKIMGEKINELIKAVNELKKGK